MSSDDTTEITLHGRTYVRNTAGHWAGPFPYLSVELESALDEIMRLRAEVERLEAARVQLLDCARGYMDMVVEERDEVERLRALITEWATAVEALRVATDYWGYADWDRAYERWDDTERALFEEARRDQ